jgi:ribosomal-protein-alanine acetyltransferase
MGPVMIRKTNIRIGTIKDLDTLVDLELRGFTADHFSRSQFAYLLIRANATTFIMESQEEIVGMAIMVWRSNSNTGRLYNIVIDPSLRGHGLGTSLLEACQNEAARRNCRKISLEVRADNKTAISFYETHGFQVQESLPGYYSDGASGLRMTRSI